MKNKLSDIRKTIPLSIPCLGGNEWKYVKECLDTNWLSYAGPFVSQFEESLAGITGANLAVATNSGTAALHVALQLLGVQPETEVILPNLTFVAPANAIRYCNAWPTLVDVRQSDWQMDPEKLKSFLSNECIFRNGGLENKMTGRRISAVLPVHLLGGMFDVDAICEIAAQFDLPVIEDAAECLGATYKDRKIGERSNHIPDAKRLVCTSFNGNKIITTSGGGALLCNDSQLAEAAKHVTTTAKTDPIEFDHDQIGFNYRMPNVAAAIGVAQLEQLDQFVVRKREIAALYHEFLEGTSAISSCHVEPENCRSTYWMYTVLLDRPARPIVDQLASYNIVTRPLWKLMQNLPYLQECYRSDCSVSLTLSVAGLSLPCSTSISDDDVTSVANVLKSLMK